VILNRGHDGVALATDRVWCDAVALEQALRASRRREALDLYGGDFLPGVFVDEGGTELDEWTERTRQSLRAKVVACAWELVELESREQPTSSALELARRARSLSPDDEQGLRLHMVLLARAGDSAGALRTYAHFIRRLRQEYDADPSPESQALAHSIRKGRVLSTGSQGLVEQSAVVQTTVPQQDQPRPRAIGWARGRLVGLVALPLMVGYGLIGTLTHTRLPAADRHLMIAEFSNHTRDSLLGIAVTAAVRAELSKIARVDLASARQVGPSYPDPVAQGGALVLVTGDVTPLGSGFTVSASLVSADGGRLLAAVQENAANVNVLLPTVRRLSERLRGNVLHSLAQGK
jgi:hypothetical protein